MTSKQRQRYLRLISQKRDEIRRRYDLRHARLVDLSAKIVGNFTDEATRSDSLGREYALEEHDLSEYRYLEEAKYRLESGSYGTCQVCGEPIEVGRLLIIPETSMCYACSEDTERSQQRFA